MNFDIEIVYTLKSIKVFSGFLVFVVFWGAGIFPLPDDKENISTKISHGKIMESSSFLLLKISYNKSMDLSKQNIKSKQDEGFHFYSERLEKA